MSVGPLESTDVSTVTDVGVPSPWAVASSACDLAASCSSMTGTRGAPHSLEITASAAPTDVNRACRPIARGPSAGRACSRAIPRYRRRGSRTAPRSAACPRRTSAWWCVEADRALVDAIAWTVRAGLDDVPVRLTKSRAALAAPRPHHRGALRRTRSDVRGRPVRRSRAQGYRTRAGPPRRRSTRQARANDEDLFGRGLLERGDVLLRRGEGHRVVGG